ncbi:Crp/Fnr family transcriptional regulator [Ekhidna sp.]|uniref:Crp/Fnr family transcriptional regulator n=1 Tax=Ekhidna sp. TaxID=2608089 RepID=UPI003297A822
MFESVIQSITSYASLSEKEIECFVEQMTPRQLDKGDLLLQTGEVCMSWAFLTKGSFREYYLDEDLNEVTTNLFTINSWVINNSSFTGQIPSKCKIEAFEESEILVIGIHDLHHLISESPAFFALGKILEVDSKKPKSSATPQEKYLQLLDQNSAIIQKFPLKYIASYLGMTPETLSRVRRKIK